MYRFLKNKKKVCSDGVRM